MQLYHITYLFNLPGIQEHGLIPGSGTTFGGWYSGYSKGWLFLTDGDGVHYWMNKLEEHAGANTDHPEEGWIPIVLRLTETADLVLETDTEGSRDSLSDAYKTRDAIDPDDLLVWTGTWEELEDVDSEELLEEVLDSSEHIYEDDTDWWELDYEYFHPPHPT